MKNRYFRTKPVNAPVTLADIRDLSHWAACHADKLLVETCERALEGDELAAAVCAERVIKARANVARLTVKRS